MHPIILPYRNNHAQTAFALLDALDQSLPSKTVILVGNGGEKLPDVPPAVLHWHFDPPLPSLALLWNAALDMVWKWGASHVLVVNNDVRLHQGTYYYLRRILEEQQAWFVSGVGVREGQYNPAENLPLALHMDANGREGSTPTQIAKGGPDFSCFVISRECHARFRFDEGFQPAYFEDNDYHRRLQLAGYGEKIFGVNLPFLHYGSGTLTADKELAGRWGPLFEQNRHYYVRKWGGLPGHETFTTPFDRGNAVGLEHGQETR